MSVDEGFVDDGFSVASDSCDAVLFVVCPACQCSLPRSVAILVLAGWPHRRCQADILLSSQLDAAERLRALRSLFSKKSLR